MQTGFLFDLLNCEETFISSCMKFYFKIFNNMFSVCCTDGQKAQIVFAFHVSSSILESEAALLKQFYTDILHKGDIESGGLKVAIIGYGDVATTYADFSRYFIQIKYYYAFNTSLKII